MTSSVHVQEARTFGHYLIGQDPSETIVRLYVRAMELRPLPASAREERVVRFAAGNRWAIGMLDGALSFTNPKSLLRQKLLLLTAIVEVQPEHARLFLPRNYAPGSWFMTGLSLSWAGCKLVAGRLLLVVV